MIGPQQNSYWYLASPYSHPDEAIRHARYEQVETALAWLLIRRMRSYSPIVHCHAMAVRHKMPTDAGFWQDYNHLMIGKADGVIVLRIEGWEQSKGVTEEREFAAQIRKPVLDLLPTPDGYLLA